MDCLSTVLQFHTFSYVTLFYAVKARCFFSFGHDLRVVTSSKGLTWLPQFSVFLLAGLFSKLLINFHEIFVQVRIVTSKDSISFFGAICSGSGFKTLGICWNFTVSCMTIPLDRIHALDNEFNKHSVSCTWTGLWYLKVQFTSKKCNIIYEATRQTANT